MSTHFRFLSSTPSRKYYDILYYTNSSQEKDIATLAETVNHTICLQSFINQSHYLHSRNQDHKHPLYQISDIHWHFIDLSTVVLLDVSKNLDIIIFNKIYCYTLQPIKNKNSISTPHNSSRQYNVINK